MNKQEIYRYLNKNTISFEAIEHQPVFTAEQARALCLPHPEAGAKNLFLRDDKKEHYYLITMRDNLQIDLKDLRQKTGSRRLSFASERELQHILNLQKGSVTPLGLLHLSTTNTTPNAKQFSTPETPKVHFFLDNCFSEKLIAVHPNESTATIYLNTEDLITLLKNQGIETTFLQL